MAQGDMPRDPHTWSNQQIGNELTPFVNGWLEQQNIKLQNGNYCLNEGQIQQFGTAIFKQCGALYNESLGGTGTQMQRESVREEGAHTPSSRASDQT